MPAEKTILATEGIPDSSSDTFKRRLAFNFTVIIIFGLKQLSTILLKFKSFIIKVLEYKAVLKTLKSNLYALLHIS